MSLLKWLFCFLAVPCFIILLLTVVVLCLKYFYISVPIIFLIIWVYIATELYDDWF